MDKISGAVFKSVLAVCLTVLIIYFSGFYKDNLLNKTNKIPDNFVVNDFVPAKKIKGGLPSYPQKSRENSEAGFVELLVSIDSLGHVEHVSIKKSSGYPSLDESAKKNVEENFVFEPASLNFKNVRSVLSLKFSFNLY